MDHDWECIEVGNWYSQYRCTICGEIDLTEPDDDYELPVDGCEGSKDDPN